MSFLQVSLKISNNFSEIIVKLILKIFINFITINRKYTTIILSIFAVFKFFQNFRIF